MTTRRTRFGPVLCAAGAIAFLITGDASRSEAPSVPAAGSTQRIAITATAGRFEPAQVHLVQGAPAVLEFTRVVESACMKAVRMPWMEEAAELPMNEKVEIPVDTSMTGVFTYACWMDMVFGEVMIHEN